MSKHLDSHGLDLPENELAGGRVELPVQRVGLTDEDRDVGNRWHVVNSFCCFETEELCGVDVRTMDEEEY